MRISSVDEECSSKISIIKSKRPPRESLSHPSLIIITLFLTWLTSCIQSHSFPVTVSVHVKRLLMLSMTSEVIPGVFFSLDMLSISVLNNSVPSLHPSLSVLVSRIIFSFVYSSSLWLIYPSQNSSLFYEWQLVCRGSKWIEGVKKHLEGISGNENDYINR